MEAHYRKFLDVIHAVRINVPLIDVLAEMPNYGKFLKELISNKHKIKQIYAAFLSDESSAMIQNKVPPKLRDPGSFLIPCNFNKTFSCNALADLGASINLMPYSLYAKLSLENLKPTKMSVRLADRSFQYPVGIAENMLVEVGKFTFPADFVILEMEEDIGTEQMIFNIDSAMKHSYSNDDTCFSIDVIDEILEEDFDALLNEEPPTDLELKPLPDNLEYVFLEEPSFLPVIILSQLSKEKKNKLIFVLNKHKQAFAWKTTDIPVVKNKIVKLLDTSIIYPIVDSPWVSPIHCVPKKGGITVVTNENDELVPTRTITGWRVCIDYRKLNKATAKDHFPLLFMDQMLERLARNKYFCFLDGFSGYFQIPIDPNDQEKTTFTCPFGTYAYRRMPFGLCNAPATFQRCMLAIFHDMIKESVEVFMDDFSVFRNSFDTCLNNLDKMIQRCKDAHLVLNWENIISWSKKELCSDTRYFLKIARPITKLLEKDTPFEFDDECQKAFESLKEKLTCAPMIVSPNWNLPFELTYDASDLAVGAVLGQKDGKSFHPIYFASKTLTSAQQKYTVIEKELMAVVFAFDKFRSYVILSKTIIHTDHSALRHLFRKQDAKPCLIRWILLLQEFDIEIEDRKGTKIFAVDHLSRLDNNETSNDSEVDDNFLRETLMEINTKDEQWFADFANYLVVAVDYVSKWAKAQALPTNDARVVITFLKKLFCRFGMPKALISDRVISVFFEYLDTDHTENSHLRSDCFTIRGITVLVDIEQKLHKALQVVCEKLNQQEQASNVSTHTPEPSRRFNFIYDDDDDDGEESTIPLNEITSQIPPSIAITPVLSTMEPEDSLIMRDENLSTIPEKESDEFIKSSVKDPVLIPSESEDTSDSDKECDLPFCDNSVTFSNPLFDANDDECFDPGGDIDEIDVFLEIDDSFPEYETFCFNIEEKISGSTTIHFDYSLPD
ncbi:reverse transcriptase domain-containing protein [Tanacetum coccineum]